MRIFFIFLGISACMYIVNADTSKPGFKSKSLLVIMPNAQILQDRLRKCGFDYFMENTDIVKKLADQQRYPIGIAIAIELCFLAYNKNLKNEETGKIIMALTKMNKFLLFEALLEGEPKALKELKDLGLYKPNK